MRRALWKWGVLASAVSLANVVAERRAHRHRDERPPTKPGALHVGVVTDWTACARGVFWDEVLDALAPKIPTNVTHYALANRSLGQPTVVGNTGDGRDSGAGFFVEQCQVLIINWDAVNGDPDFGADFARRWFHHRRREILLWVEAGGVLVIESQTILGAAAQQAYDALLGPGELRVSQPESEVAPRAEWRRIGASCRYTRAARRSRLFRDLRDPECTEGRTFVEMFPGSAQQLLTPRIRGEKRQDLYRGWFRWNPVRRTHLPWVPVVKTDKRRFDHPTMLAAKHGAGAIFASTMLLSAARQLDLVETLLQAAKDPGALPERPRRLALLQNAFTRLAVSLVAASGLAAAASGALGESWVFQGLATTVLLAAVAFGVTVLFVAPRLLRRLARDVLGW